MRLLRLYLAGCTAPCKKLARSLQFNNHLPSKAPLTCLSISIIDRYFVDQKS